MKLHGYFKDGVIIQADQNYIVKGFAEKNETVTVTLIKEGVLIAKESTISDNKGFFAIKMPPIMASFDAYVIDVIAPSGKITVSDVLFGDVYFLTGQSNMAYLLNYHDDKEKFFNQYKNKFVRVQKLRSTVVKSVSPYGFLGLTEEQSDYLDNFPWLPTDSEDIFTTSAFGFFFGAKMIKNCNCPIGLVDSSVGGSSVENWYSIEWQKSTDGLREYDDRLAIRDGLCRVGSIWTEKVCPLYDVAFKGMIWYQGCSNCYNDYDGLNYNRMFRGFLTCLFNKFRYKFPYAVVNVHPHYITDFGKSYVNEQFSILENEDDNCVAVPYLASEYPWHQGEELNFHPIHPTRKDKLAFDCADYFYAKFIDNKPIVTPHIDTVEFFDGYAIATVKSTGKLIKEDKVFGFTIAGENKKYYTAKASVISDNQVKIHHPSVNKPKFITYAFFMNSSCCNLMTETGAVVQYRTDEKTSVYTSDYAMPNPIYHCRIAKTWCTAPNYLYGESALYDTWQKGLFSGKGEVIVDNDGVNIIYDENSNKELSLISASPNLSLINVPTELNRYRYMTVSIKSTEAVNFIGILFKPLINKRLYALKSTVINAGETAQFTFDLTETIRDGTANATAKLSDATEMQFTFKPTTANAGKITILDVTLHD